MKKISEQSIYHQIKPILENIYKKLGKPIVFFDLETTGLDIVKDEILQIYICRYDGVDFKEDISLYNIFGEIRKEAFDKHKISKESLVGYPYFKDVAKDIFDSYFSNTEDIICGFNSNKFDVPFIIEKFLQCKLLESVNIIKNPKIDVYKVYRELYPNTLEGIYQRFTGVTLENSHSADTDIMATTTILGSLIEQNPDLDFIDTDIMVDAGGFFKIEDNILKFTMGKYKDLPLRDVDRNELSSYLNWVIGNGSFSTHTKIVARKILEKYCTECN